MGNAGEQTGLHHAEAERYVLRAAVRIGYADAAAAALDGTARRMRASTTSSRATPSNSKKVVAQVGQARDLVRRTDAGRCGGGCQARPGPRQRHHLTPGLQIAEQCEHRQQYRDRPAAGHAAVRTTASAAARRQCPGSRGPRDHQQRELDPAKRRRGDPERIQFLGVTFIQSELRRTRRGSPRGGWPAAAAPRDPA